VFVIDAAQRTQSSAGDISPQRPHWRAAKVFEWLLAKIFRPKCGCFRRHALVRFHDAHAGEFRLGAQFFFDAQELSVFCRAVGAGERPGLDLPAIGGDGEVGDG
jgi:hypothetical protein